jgi:hypothetical protein
MLCCMQVPLVLVINNLHGREMHRTEIRSFSQLKQTGSLESPVVITELRFYLTKTYGDTYVLDRTDKPVCDW